MPEIFSSTPEDFHNLPIRRPILESTGLPEGDDSGYRKVPVDESEELVVDLQERVRDVMLRLSYDGVQEQDGVHDPKIVLPGGTAGIAYVRASVAEAVGVANDYLADRYGNSVQLGILDAFRSGLRQSAGFTRIALQLLKGNTNPSLGELYRLGNQADGTFAFVNPDDTSKIYQEFAQDLMSGSHRAELEAIAAETSTSLEDVIFNFIAICANIYEVKDHFQNVPNMPLNMRIPLNFQNNAHAGGGAIDTFLMVRDGSGLWRPGSAVPFDYVGPEAGIEYTEKDENLELFRAKVAKDPLLQIHLERLGLDPNNVRQQDWDFWKACNRILSHTLKAIGATYYSAANPADGGENWHYEPGNIVRDPKAGHILYEGGFADRYYDSGNPGHAKQRGAAKAVWGGRGAHQQLGF